MSIVGGLAKKLGKEIGQKISSIGVIKEANKHYKTGKIVLGRYPEYTNQAKKINANTFEIPTKIWKKMNTAEQWESNRKFLDRAIKRGDDILLATPVDDTIKGSYYEKEISYLNSKGYSVSKDGKRMIKK